MRNMNRAAYAAVTAAVLGACVLAGSTGTSVKPVEIEKSEFSNPVMNFRNDDWNYIYGGDPSVMVDGDTVYLYTGHDASSDREVNQKIYNIPEYLCYSSTDLVHWQYNGAVFSMSDVDWADAKSAWASQVIKHKDPEDSVDRYYLYYCSWDNTSHNEMSIGCAVSDSPEGPFSDIGHPLVSSLITSDSTSTFNDIDPTVWIDTDENGDEHRYLGWGNGKFYICELNEDMTSVRDLNNDKEITLGTDREAGDGDIYLNNAGLGSYTEAPWLYRRSDENGEYYGDYYLFYASGWREGLSYATAADPFSRWSFGDIIQDPNATSNTSHPAVFDFEGHTYIVSHDGALPAGNGYRRSATIRELNFNDDGTVQYFEESTSGLDGKAVKISSCSQNTETGTDNGASGFLSHKSFTNPSSDTVYPLTEVLVGSGLSDKEADMEWVIVDGKSAPDDKTCVSIESENKTGLFITTREDETAVLSQDTDATPETAASQTFITMEALNKDKDAVSFQSVSMPDYYLTVNDDGTLCLQKSPDKASASFIIH